MHATNGDNLSVHYTGWLIDGEGAIFDTSLKKEFPSTFSLDLVKSYRGMKRVCLVCAKERPEHYLYQHPWDMVREVFLEPFQVELLYILQLSSSRFQMENFLHQLEKR